MTREKFDSCIYGKLVCIYACLSIHKYRLELGVKCFNAVFQLPSLVLSLDTTAPPNWVMLCDKFECETPVGS